MTLKITRNSFRMVVANFLGDHKTEKYKEPPYMWLLHYEEVDCNMFLKIHLSHVRMFSVIHNFCWVGDQHENFNFFFNFYSFWPLSKQLVENILLNLKICLTYNPLHWTCAGIITTIRFVVRNIIYLPFIGIQQI